MRSKEVADRADCLVEMTQLDILLAGQRINFVKVDIKGMEIKVLKGVRE